MLGMESAPWGRRGLGCDHSSRAGMEQKTEFGERRLGNWEVRWSEESSVSMP